MSWVTYEEISEKTQKKEKILEENAQERKMKKNGRPHEVICRSTLGFARHLVYIL
jgi:hypothetical protein